MMFRLLAGLVALILPLSAMAQDKVLRAVMHADVRVIDPIWTTQTIANIHGALVYDTLFGNDADQKPQPQMVGKYEISPDRLDLYFHSAGRAKIPRRLAGHHQGRHRFAEALGRQGRRRPASDGLCHRDGRRRRQDLQDGAARALRHGAGIARQERQLDRRHHAREGRAHRSAAAGQGIGRLRSVHLRQDQWVPGSKAVYLKNKDYVPRTAPPSPSPAPRSRVSTASS